MKISGAFGKSVVLSWIPVARLKRLGWLSDQQSTTADQKAESVPVGVQETSPAGFPLLERQTLLEHARKTLISVVTHAPLPQLEPLLPLLSEPRACFVTLFKDGILRGCIGQVLPQGPLHAAVAENARKAALSDPRFSPVQVAELAAIRIEISVLTRPEALPFDSPNELLSKLRPRYDGVWLQIGSAGALFLPQVWSQIPDKVDFLDRLAEKAGCLPWAWRTKGVSAAIFHSESFAEGSDLPSAA